MERKIFVPLKRESVVVFEMRGGARGGRNDSLALLLISTSCPGLPLPNPSRKFVKMLLRERKNDIYKKQNKYINKKYKKYDRH